jgi:hypothetical protein
MIAAKAGAANIAAAVFAMYSHRGSITLLILALCDCVTIFKILFEF